MIASIVDFSSTISLGVVILGLITIAFTALAVWRTQDIGALRTANGDLRQERDDWRQRFEDQREEHNHDRDRQDAKIAVLSAECQELRVQVAKLEGMTDTTKLARDESVLEFRQEVREQLKRFDEHDARLLTLVETLVSRDHTLRTRTTDTP